MFVRVLALLVALGFLAGTAYASVNTTVAASALVEEIDEADVDVVMIAVDVPAPREVRVDLIECPVMPRVDAQPVFVFRPPRAPAFG